MQKYGNEIVYDFRTYVGTYVYVCTSFHDYYFRFNALAGTDKFMYKTKICKRDTPAYLFIPSHMTHLKRQSVCFQLCVRNGSFKLGRPIFVCYVWCCSSFILSPETCACMCAACTRGNLYTHIYMSWTICLSVCDPPQINISDESFPNSGVFRLLGADRGTCFSAGFLPTEDDDDDDNDNDDDDVSFSLLQLLT